MMTVFRKVSLAFLVLIALLVAGCAGREDDLNRYIDEVKARPATPIAPIPTSPPTASRKSYRISAAAL